MAKIPRIDVLSITVLKDAGALLAYASVSLAGLITIHEVRIVKQAGQPAIALIALLPQKVFVDEAGVRRYSTLLEFTSREWRTALTAAVLSAWNDHPGGIRSVEARPTTFRDEVRRRAGLVEQT